MSKHQTESDNDPFSSNQVINLIKNHSTVLTNYLEYVVFKLKIEVSINEKKKKNKRKCTD